MERLEAIDYLKTMLPEYVSHITSPDRRAGRDMYKCPLCGSGSSGRRNSNGAFSIDRRTNRTTWKCFSCNESGDIFNLIEKYEGLADFNDQLNRAADLFSVSIDGKKEGARMTRRERRQAQPKPEPEKKPVVDFSGYIEKCRAAVGKTNYLKNRGFSPEIIERFRLGYDEKENAVVIPYSDHYFIRRNLDPEEHNGRKYYKPVADMAGNEPIFNLQALYSGEPCFICEGQLDAISIAQSGAQAAAIGGGGRYKLIDQLKEKPATASLIISPDYDEPGQKTAAALADDLDAIGVEYIIANYSLEAYPEGHQKDTNDFLTGNPEQLQADIIENLKKAKEVNGAALTVAECQTDFFNWIDEDIRKKIIPCDIKAIDEMNGGGLPIGLTLIMGESSVGKTALALNMAENIAETGKEVLFFSTEMTRNICIARGISRKSKIIEYSDIITGKVNKEEYRGAAQAYFTGCGDHFHFVECFGGTTPDYIEKIIKQHENPVVFIDYLQQLNTADGKTYDERIKMKRVATDLLKICNENNIAMVVLSSVSRENYGKRLGIESGKESGELEYNAACVMGIQYTEALRKDLNREEREIEKARKDGRLISVTVLKNRLTCGSGVSNFNFKAGCNRFIDMQEELKAGAQQWAETRQRKRI